MKSFLTTLILILSLQTWVQADIIKFEIEGMSIGDSALNFFSEKDIKNNSKDYYRDKTFTPVQNDKYPFFEIYDAVDFNFRTGDKGYILQSISGVLYFDKKNIKDCYNKMDSLISDIKEELNYIKYHSKKEHIHPADISGESKFTEARFDLKNGYIGIICYDYSMVKSQDHLSVYVDTKEFNKWARGDIY